MSAHNEAQLKKFKTAKANLERSIAHLPREVGEIAVNFSKDNFIKEGFLGYGFERWKKRKGNVDPGRGLLRKSGRLYRSVRVVGVTPRSVTIGSDVPYARAHNEGHRGPVRQKVHTHYRRNRSGGKSRVRNHTRAQQMNLRKRQFIGPSPYLNTRISRHIGSRFLKAFRM